MGASIIGGIIGVAVFIIGYILYGTFKSGKQMSKLQDMAVLFNDEFKDYVKRSEGWKVEDNPENKRKWFKLIPDRGNPYYITFEGPIPFQTAVDFLMKGFMTKMNKER